MILRRTVNVLNLSTPLGLLLALAGRARLARGPDGVIVAHGYRARVPAPRASAVTVGDVVLLRLPAEQLAGRPRLLEHEARHARQWAWFLGPVGFVPAYLAASVWSWLRCRDFAVRNPFEVHAGLADGGYVPRPPGRRPKGQLPAGDDVLVGESVLLVDEEVRVADVLVVEDVEWARVVDEDMPPAPG